MITSSKLQLKRQLLSQLLHILTLRLILIAEKQTVYRKFPTPLINRLEKHIVVTSDILSEAQQQVLKKLKKWLQDFSGADSVCGKR